jgi:hypothetical protein
MGLDQIKELAAHMRHAGRFPDATPLIEWIEPGVGIGLQDARELSQMPLRMFP